MSEDLLTLIRLQVRSDLWHRRTCTMCEDPDLGEHWKAVWGCTTTAQEPLRLSDTVLVHRCPLALLRETDEIAALNWVQDALNLYESHNLAAMGELSAAGMDALYCAVSALRDRQQAERDKRADELERERGKSKSTVRPRSPGRRQR